jgi:hypothetical protein
MSRDDYAQQGKQFVNDLRDTVSKKVSDNEETILGGLGKAARWVDQKTGGKYSDQIGKAEAKVGEGVGWAAKQGTGEPQAPGAAAGDGSTPTGTPGEATTGPVTPPPATPPPPGGPAAPGAGPTPAGSGAATAGPVPPEPATGPVGPPTQGPGTPLPTEHGSGRERPTHPPRDDAADWPRPPQS